MRLPSARSTVRDVSWASSPAIRRTMQGNRGRDTAPEIALRSALHRRGLRFRTVLRPVPGLRRTVDIAFTRARVAVLVDGCFWHGCSEHHVDPATNAAFWRDKLRATQLRDADTDARLSAAGWTVVRVWEHEDPEAAADRVVGLVREAMAGAVP